MVRSIPFLLFLPLNLYVLCVLVSIDADKGEGYFSKEQKTKTKETKKHPIKFHSVTFSCHSNGDLTQKQSSSIPPYTCHSVPFISPQIFKFHQWHHFQQLALNCWKGHGVCCLYYNGKEKTITRTIKEKKKNRISFFITSSSILFLWSCSCSCSLFYCHFNSYTTLMSTCALLPSNS